MDCGARHRRELRNACSAIRVRNRGRRGGDLGSCREATRSQALWRSSVGFPDFAAHDRRRRRTARSAIRFLVPRLRGRVGVVLRGGETPRVWGVVAVDDVSVRDPYFASGAPRIDEGPLTWVLQKNFRGGTACGPWVVVDEDLDENDLDIQTRVNGVLRQSGSTSEMVYSFADVVDHLHGFIPLRAGDIIASGTPEGTAFEEGADGPFLVDGDEVVVEVEGVGYLRNVVGKTPTGSGTAEKGTADGK
ncbi:fumarylacetoacetate hydrolase family protein [Rhodococcus opacus]|nr:fumarylacetoacetate hydrolase family protein [Rhodococcus opacus]